MHPNKSFNIVSSGCIYEIASEENMLYLLMLNIDFREKNQAQRLLDRFSNLIIFSENYDGSCKKCVFMYTKKVQ